MFHDQHSSNNENPTGGVHIGDVTGDIRDVIIAGRDVVLTRTKDKKDSERDLTIPQPPHPYFSRHYPLGANFTGRRAERQMLHQWLTDKNTPVLALVAMGGMGKSSLVWCWLQHDLDRSNLDGLLWWSFEGGATAFPEFLTTAIQYISDQTIDPTQLSFHDQVQVLINLLREHAVLIVFDSFEDQLRAYAHVHETPQTEITSQEARSCFDPFAAQCLKRLASEPTQSKLLITTRLMPQDLEDMSGEPLYGCRQAQLGPLSPDNAVAFMREQGVIQGTDGEISAACRSYGYHPLSLRILSGLIKRDKRQPGDVAVAQRYRGHTDLTQSQEDILATAYHALSRPLRALLSRLAAVRGAMSYDVLQVFNDFEDEVAFEQALEELIERGLLSFDADRAQFDLHTLVRAYAYKQLSNPIEVHTQLWDYFTALPAPDPKEIQTMGDLSTLIECYHHMIKSRHFDEAWQLYESRLREPLYYKFCVYEIEVQLLGGLLDPENGHPQVQGTVAKTWVWIFLSMSYERMGQLDSALTYVKQAVALNRKEGRKADLGSSLVALASVERKLGHLKSAEEVGAQAVAIFDDIGDTNWFSISHRNHGGSLMLSGKFTEARRQLDLAEKAYRYRPNHFAHGLTSLLLYRTDLLEFQGMYAAALKTARRAYEIACSGLVEPQEDAKASLGKQIRAAVRRVMRQVLPGRSADRKVQVSRLENATYKREATTALYHIGYLQHIAGNLEEAQLNLETALQSCRSVRLTDLEPDVLLALAKLRAAQAQSPEERVDIVRYAQDALALAERCNYRLKQVKVHAFLARWALKAGQLPDARRHADRARTLAWCDGPPHAYQPALEEAEELLQTIKRREQR